VFGFNNKVEVKHSMAYTALGERVSMGPSEVSRLQDVFLLLTMARGRDKMSFIDKG